MSNFTKEQAYCNIVEGLSFLIRQNFNACASEQYHPGGDPDRMDEIIKETKNKALAYRKLRDEFEVIYTGVLL